MESTGAGPTLTEATLAEAESPNKPAVPLSDLLLEKCAVCAKPEAKKRCGRCKVRWYCSVDCQKLDWHNGHNFNCNAKGALAVGLKLGMKVHARYQGGTRLFPGTIRKINDDGTVDILYDDGEWESEIPAMRVQQEGQKQKKYLEKGTEVECRCASWGDQLLHGRVVNYHQTEVIPDQLTAATGRPPSWAFTYDVKFDHGLVERQVPRKFIFAAYTFPPPPGSEPPLPPPPSVPGAMEPTVVPARSALDHSSAVKARKQASNSKPATSLPGKGPLDGTPPPPVAGQTKRKKPPRRKTMTGAAPPEELARMAAQAAVERQSEAEGQESPPVDGGGVDEMTCPVTGESAAGATKLDNVVPGACPYSGQRTENDSADSQIACCLVTGESAKGASQLEGVEQGACPYSGLKGKPKKGECPYSGQRADGRERLENVEKGRCPYTGRKPGEKTDDGVCPWTGKAGTEGQALPEVEAGKCPYSGMPKPKLGMYEDDDDTDEEEVRNSFKKLAEEMGDDGTGGCSFAKLAQKDGEGESSCPFSGNKKANDIGLPLAEFRKRVAEAEAEIVEIISDPARGTDHLDEAKVHEKLCDLYIKQEKGKPAVKHAERALQILEYAIEDQEEAGEEGQDREEEGQVGSLELTYAYDKVGKAHYSNNNDEEAMKWFQKALNLRRKDLGKDHPSIGASYINIGNVFQYRGDPGRAIEYYEMSLDLRKAKYGENHPDVAISYYSLATGYEYASDFEMAIENYKNSVEVFKKTLGEEHELTKKAGKCLDQALTDKEQCVIS
mmetsp:Transcript_14653/g.19291  ORF Transcript_14653/g.19291 Transcript_14653/m.19291 type:complete len:782 (+) Transcript_14653:375-2720(+)